MRSASDVGFSFSHVNNKRSISDVNQSFGNRLFSDGNSIESLPRMALFAAVVREGGFGKAAAAFGVSKSHVSKQISALHQCLLYEYQAAPTKWTFRRKGRRVETVVSGRLRSNNGDFLAAAALAGHGLAYLPDFIARDYLQLNTIPQSTWWSHCQCPSREPSSKQATRIRV